MFNDLTTRWHRHRDALTVLLLLCVALPPRLFTLGRAFTTDEAHQWVAYRSSSFLEAVVSGHFADTIITGHPGVTTMWLGSIGLLLERALQAAGLLAQSPAFEVHLTLMRLPLACLTALIIPLAWLLLRRVLTEDVALLAALLWASDPFLIAHSRVLHLDALLSMLMLLALLALLAACFDRQGPREAPHLPALLLAGGATGLALLTKSPAIFLLPMGGLTLLVWFWQRPPRLSLSGPRLLMVAGMLWVGVAALTVLLLWPALWAAPAQAVASVASEAAGNSTEPHKGNFLLGQSFLFDAPGPLYYPVTLFSRLTPWVLLGLLLAAAVPLSWRGPRRVPMLLLLCAALLFVAILSTLPKKLDRYALPAVPLLHILAAAGLALLWDRLRATGQRMQDDWHRLHRSLLPPLFFLVLALTLVIYHPYYLAYYSPLTGLLRPLGSAETERAHPVTDVVLVGWGEGLDRAADWLNAQPGIEAGEVATWSAPTLRPYLDTGVTWQGDTDERDRVNYLVVYVNQEQTGREAQYIDQVHGRCPVSHTVRLHGIDYAWIYELPLVRIAQPPGAQFGQVFTLADYVLEPPDACDCSPLTLTLAFQPLSRPAQPHFFFIHVIDSNGQTVQQLDIPLENLIVSAAWQSGETLFHPLEIPLPETAPPGDYRVIVGLYEPGTGAQVPITVNAGQEASTGAGTGTLHIATFQKTRIYQQQCAAP